jgi:hypothetical protein
LAFGLSARITPSASGRGIPDLVFDLFWRDEHNLTVFPHGNGITGAFVIADSFFYSSPSRVDYSILEPFVGVRLQINFR